MCDKNNEMKIMKNNENEIIIMKIIMKMNNEWIIMKMNNR